MGDDSNGDQRVRMSYIALVDCNSFYCSCEKIFRPDLRGRPVIVLSNNDGAAVAFTKEAKALGFGQMCEPFFKLKDRVKKHKVTVFSSNYAYYDDISKRVMNVLRDFSPTVEVYSVDEAFIELEGASSNDLEKQAAHIRSEIMRRVGMPVGIGISHTKVLAKVANKISKRTNGVKALVTDEEIADVLKTFSLRDVWGLGLKSATKLSLLRLQTAWDLRCYKNDVLIQKILTKVGREIQDELRGVRCLTIEEIEDLKNTGNSRSFGYDVRSKSELREAVAQFTTNAAAKLRAQDSVCYGIMTYIRTNPFKSAPQYFAEDFIRFTSPTSDTIKLIQAAHEILDRIYRPGFGYKKAGVLLTHIVPRGEGQLDLFEPNPDDNETVNKVIDLINKKYGPQTIKSAACGSKQPWKTVHDYKSQHYTTKWSDILKVEL